MRPTAVEQFQLEQKSGIIVIWMISSRYSIMKHLLQNIANRLKMFLSESIFGNEKSFCCSHSKYTNFQNVSSREYLKRTVFKFTICT